MKALVGAFSQEKALVGAFSVIVQLHRLIDLRHCSVRVRAVAVVARLPLSVPGLGAAARPPPGHPRPGLPAPEILVSAANTHL